VTYVFEGGLAPSTTLTLRSRSSSTMYCDRISVIKRGTSASTPCISCPAGRFSYVSSSSEVKPADGLQDPRGSGSWNTDGLTAEPAGVKLTARATQIVWTVGATEHPRSESCVEVCAANGYQCAEDELAKVSTAAAAAAAAASINCTDWNSPWDPVQTWNFGQGLSQCTSLSACGESFGKCYFSSPQPCSATGTNWAHSRICPCATDVVFGSQVNSVASQANRAVQQRNSSECRTIHTAATAAYAYTVLPTLGNSKAITFSLRGTSEAYVGFWGELGRIFGFYEIGWSSANPALECDQDACKYIVGSGPSDILKVLPQGGNFELPLIQPSLQSASPFTIDSAGTPGCQIDLQGCATNFKQRRRQLSHDTLQLCYFRTNRAVIVSVTRYVPENYNDFLTVKGQEYRRPSRGPKGVVVPANSVISWSKDYYSSNSGFTLCGRSFDFEAPSDLENVGAMMEGYFRPPATGLYRIAVESSSSSEVWVASRPMFKPSSDSIEGLTRMVTSSSGDLTWGQVDVPWTAGNLYYVRSLSPTFAYGIDHIRVGVQVNSKVYHPIPIKMLVNHPTAEVTIRHDPGNSGSAAGIKARAPDLGMLSGIEARPFWVDVTGGLVRVGHGIKVGQQQFLKWQDPAPLSAAHVGVQTIGQANRNIWNICHAGWGGILEQVSQRVSVGAQVWRDRQYTFTSIPSFLLDGEYLQQPHEAITSGTTIQFSVNSAGLLAVAVEPTRNRDCGWRENLVAAGWTDMELEMTWQGIHNTTQHTGKLSVYTRQAEAGNVSLPASTTPQCVAVFMIVAKATGARTNTGAMECRSCAAGTFAIKGLSKCQVCAPGQFDDDQDSATPCLDCPAGFFSNATGAKTCDGVCPSGSYATAGSTTREACRQCRVGQHDDDSVTGHTSFRGLINQALDGPTTSLHSSNVVHGWETVNATLAFADVDGRNAVLQIVARSGAQYGELRQTIKTMPGELYSVIAEMKAIQSQDRPVCRSDDFSGVLVETAVPSTDTSAKRTQCPAQTHFDCRGALISGSTASGIYNVNFGSETERFAVYCDMERDGGGWTLLLTQTDAQSNFGGSVVPFKQNHNQSHPSLTNVYARDWSDSGVGLLPVGLDQFMIVKNAANVSNSESAVMTLDNWCAGPSWLRTDALGCGGQGYPGYGHGQVQYGHGHVQHGHGAFNFHGCSHAGQCALSGGDAAGFSRHSSWAHGTSECFGGCYDDLPLATSHPGYLGGQATVQPWRSDLAGFITGKTVSAGVVYYVWDNDTSTVNDLPPIPDIHTLRSQCAALGLRPVRVDSAQQIYDVLRPMLQRAGYDLRRNSGVPLAMDYWSRKKYLALDDANVSVPAVSVSPWDPRLKMVEKGVSGCTSSQRCGLCEGDCDYDYDCKVGFKCFQRNGFAAVPGCKPGGSGDINDWDYCYEPNAPVTFNTQDQYLVGFGWGFDGSADPAGLTFGTSLKGWGFQQPMQAIICSDLQPPGAGASFFWQGRRTHSSGSCVDNATILGVPGGCAGVLQIFGLVCDVDLGDFPGGSAYKGTSMRKLCPVTCGDCVANSVGNIDTMSYFFRKGGSSPPPPTPHCDTRLCPLESNQWQTVSYAFKGEPGRSTTFALRSRSNSTTYFDSIKVAIRGTSARTPCADCPAGKYAGTHKLEGQEHSIAATCIDCPSDTFSHEAATECSPCPGNLVSAPGSSSCVCPSNTWPPNSDSVNCVTCPAGTVHFPSQACEGAQSKLTVTDGKGGTCKVLVSAAGKQSCGYRSPFGGASPFCADNTELQPYCPQSSSTSTVACALCSSDLKSTAPEPEPEPEPEPDCADDAEGVLAHVGTNCSAALAPCTFWKSVDAAIRGRSREHIVGDVATCKRACCVRDWCTSFDYYKGSSHTTVNTIYSEFLPSTIGRSGCHAPPLAWPEALLWHCRC
jgi:hypothetical protein